MSDSSGPRGIVFAHGQMAEGMVDAARRIAGVGHDVLVSLSNEGLTPESMLQEVEALTTGEAVVVFTDLLSGSCAMAARLSSREHPERVVVCGVNLPMLLDFVFHRDMPLPELLDRLVSKGRSGIQALRPPV